MRKLLVVLGASLALALTAGTAPGAAQSSGRAQRGEQRGNPQRAAVARRKSVKRRQRKLLKCNRTFNGVTARQVVVPRNGACILKRSTVKGSVQVLGNAYFEARKTSIRGDVEGRNALTIFIHSNSRVARQVVAKRTPQVFLFGSTVGNGVQARDAISDFGHVQLCGMTILEGDVFVEVTGRDVFVGDPRAGDCPGNSVRRGNVAIQRNYTDIELIVSGNRISSGSLTVSGNSGPSEKLVQGNTGAGTLTCEGNTLPFVATANLGWQQQFGQCL